MRRSSKLACLFLLAASVGAWSRAVAQVGPPNKPAALNTKPTTSSVRKSVAANVEIPLSAGTTLFEVADPSLAQSPAVRLDPDPLGGGGAPTRIDGFTLTSRIIVRADDGVLVGRLAKGLNLNAVPADPTGVGLKGFWFVDAPSVTSAANAALSFRKDRGIREAYLDVRLPIVDRSIPSDPMLADQWHLINTLVPAADINVEGAWMNGHTGAGVTICILEGGWSITHPDLASRYNAAASQAGGTSSPHATSTAGLAAASANDGIGGVGVAFDAMLSKAYYGSSSVIAAAFSFENNLNHIKSNSWGPTDSGRLWTNSSLERAAIEDASINGRSGLGEIFIWAAGNGRAALDRCDYDPYASNRRAIAVGAIDFEDIVSQFSEPGASLMLVAPSRRYLSGEPDRGIVTTTTGDSYTDTFGGTSAAAPIAAGTVALMLSANPALTARDVQHVLIHSARRCNPGDASWFLNGAGRWTSDDFGFGAIDASAAVALAIGWAGVAPEAQYLSPATTVGLTVPDNSPISMGGGISSTIVVPKRMRVERAQVVLNAPHVSVGQLRVRLISPSGTQSLLASPRTDTAPGQFNNYELTSVRCWDEFADGAWTLTLADEVAGTTGTFIDWSLRIFGTEPACPADWNMDGAVDPDDLFAFLDSWFGGAGDFDQAGGTTPDDLFAFLDAWFAGWGGGSGC